MLGRLFLLFVLTPIVEMALLVQLGTMIGFWPTIGIILTTGLLGSYLARREGFSVWRRLNAKLNTGQLPGAELVDGVIILVAGALLITPGVLTDVVGFLGLIPWSRTPIRQAITKRFSGRVKEGAVRFTFTGPPSQAAPAEPVWRGEAEDLPGYAASPDEPR